MTFDPKKPIQTRDGRKARIICSDRLGGDPIIACVMSVANLYENIYAFKKDGRVSSTRDSSADLVNVAEKTSTWGIVWHKTSSTFSLPSRKYALRAGLRNATEKSPLVGLLRRDYEDGKFVHAEFEAYEGS